MVLHLHATVYRYVCLHSSYNMYKQQNYYARTHAPEVVTVHIELLLRARTKWLLLALGCYCVRGWDNISIYQLWIVSRNFLAKVQRKKSSQSRYKVKITNVTNITTEISYKTSVKCRLHGVNPLKDISRVRHRNDLNLFMKPTTNHVISYHSMSFYVMSWHDTT